MTRGTPSGGPPADLVPRHIEPPVNICRLPFPPPLPPPSQPPTVVRPPVDVIQPPMPIFHHYVQHPPMHMPFGGPLVMRHPNPFPPPPVYYYYRPPLPTNIFRGPVPFPLPPIAYMSPAPFVYPPLPQPPPQFRVQSPALMPLPPPHVVVLPHPLPPPPQVLRSFLSYELRAF